VIVTINNEQDDLTFDTSSLPTIVEEVVRHEGQSADEVSLHFVDEATICTLHQKYFHDPSFTDCISFPMHQEGASRRILGDIFVCPLAAVSYAETSGGDPYEEVLLYVIHGLLHLMGYDDIGDKESQEMRQAETRHLDHLKRLKLSIQSQ